jgi:hypothetical protein
MESNGSRDALAGQGRRATSAVDHVTTAAKAADPTRDDAASDDLLLRLAPFDAVERYREAWKRCGYMEH